MSHVKSGLPTKDIDVIAVKDIEGNDVMKVFLDIIIDLSLKNDLST